MRRMVVPLRLDVVVTLVFGSSLSCSLMLDTDYDKYGPVRGSSGAGGTVETGGTGGVGGNAGAPVGGTAGTTGGTGGTAGTSGTAGTGAEGGEAGIGGTSGSAGQAGGGEICGTTSPSCASGLVCTGTTSCCESRALPGGNFPMGQYGVIGSTPEHTALVDSGCLDTFEVTVGRFRTFVETYEVPEEGVGAHPKVPNSGWRAAWASSIAQDAAQLRSDLACGQARQTWTNDPAGNELLPINCVTWFEAFAFCAWDGGRLLSEAEWEYAAAGGPENRPFPWGIDTPTENTANYCQNMILLTCEDSPQAVSAVGSTPAGTARWGHQDLGGNLWEWTKDWYSENWYKSECSNCVNVDAGENKCVASSLQPARVARGGSFNYPKDAMQSYHRGCNRPTYRGDDVGFRCIRDLP